jgi:SAM-dependent methyltransferase
MWEKLKRWIRFNLLYLGHPRWDTGVSPPELISYLNNHRAGCALDLGCGTGTNLLTMAEKGWDVTGVDMAWLPVLRARKKLGENGFSARVICGNAAGNLKLSKKFDFILDIGCYHNLSERDRVAYQTNIKRWLTNKGHFLIFSHLRTALSRTHGVSKDDFATFASFLDLEWRKDSQDCPSEGHPGRPSTWACYKRVV